MQAKISQQKKDTKNWLRKPSSVPNSMPQHITGLVLRLQKLKRQLFVKAAKFCHQAKQYMTLENLPHFSSFVFIMKGIVLKFLSMNDFPRQPAARNNTFLF